MGAQHTDTDTYTYTAARAVEASDLSPPRKSRASAITPVKMPRPSLVFSLLTLGSLLLLTIDASPVFVDNPSLAQCKYPGCPLSLPLLNHQWGKSSLRVSGNWRSHLAGITQLEDIRLEMQIPIPSGPFFYTVSQELQHFLSRRQLRVFFREGTDRGSITVITMELIQIFKSPTFNQKLKET